MIRQIVRFAGKCDTSEVTRSWVRALESFDEEVNQHLSLGWKLVSAGFCETFVWAIIQVEV